MNRPLAVSLAELPTGMRGVVRALRGGQELWRSRSQGRIAA